MTYLCQRDEGGHLVIKINQKKLLLIEITTKIFRSSMKFLFDKYDKSKSGQLNLDSLKLMLNDHFERKFK